MMDNASDSSKAAVVLVRTAMEGQTSVIDTQFIHRLQFQHFLLFDVIPLAAILLLPFYFHYITPGWFELVLFFSLWLVTGIGVTVGYHRLFTHKSFQCAAWLQAFLAVAGSMAAQGGVISWVATHRLHHRFSDVSGDLHSPNLHGVGFLNRLGGLLHSHFLWMWRHSYPNVYKYAPDLLRSRLLSKINRHYHLWVFTGLLIPTVLGGLYHASVQGAVSGFFWGGVFRIFVLEHIIWAINSVLHTVGSRAYETKEHSRNMGFLSIPTLGESWHNNHHGFANSPNFGLVWYNPDPGYWFIKLMHLCGAAWDLRLPDPAQVQNLRRQPVKLPPGQ